MNETYDTEVNGWFIVQLIDNDNNIMAEVLWDIVEHDKKMRFKSGDYVCTSVITNKSERYVYTYNSTYKLLGTGVTNIHLSMDKIMLLRQGISPDMIINMQNKENL